METNTMPLITFNELLPHDYPPIRAMKTGVGQLPAEIHKCEAARTASSFGWHIFLPCDFQILFDGSIFLASLDDGREWFQFDALFYPDFAEVFDAAAPENCRTFQFPWIKATEFHSILQIWSGYIVRTEPGYSTWVRGPINYLNDSGSNYYQLEGIIETDWWHGPLFTNIKILKTDTPIQFYARRPFLQLIPILREQYAQSHLGDVLINRKENAFEGVDWEWYHQWLVHPALNPKERQVAHYAAEARKRQAAVERGNA
jgi:hypothetical protein